jgi:arylsulfatase A-like enzyme/cytochrome c-type biogenesis protein CcmH/NrfG
VSVVAAIVAGLAGWYFTHRTSPVHGVRNVVLISIDTCRADHLSSYGFKRNTTPHIDAVARDGVLFQDALTPVPLTTPAHSSVFTGTYPPTHGVRLNNGVRLADSNVTLAEVLREAGFKTAGFVSGFPLDPQFGLDQGFDTYDAKYTKTSARSTTHSERSAEEVSRPALAWLDHHKDERFFLFLHYFDAHAPYEPPEPYRSSYADDPYSGEIAYLDGWIGQVMDRLRALGRYDDTLIVIMGDHGEGLGDHGEAAHGFLVYQATEHVPLFIHAPHGVTGRRIEGRVSLVDLMPTILDLAGLTIPDRVQGTSLRRALQGEPVQAVAAPLYCESLQPTQFDCSALQGIVSGPWKYIRAPRQELYDLARDPAEANNLIAKEQPTAQRLRDRLEEMLHEMEAAAPQRDVSTADPAAVRQLQSLGYVGGSAEPATSAFTPGLEDPKDFVPVFERLMYANSLSEANRDQDAERELREIVATRPGLIAAHLQLAQIARHQRRVAETAERCTTIVKLLTASGKDKRQLAEAHYNLAFALRDLGRDAEAIGHYEDALRLRPDYVDALNSLGLALARAGRFGDAIARYDEALRIQPDNPQVHNNLGNALRQTGRLAAAIGHYEQALRFKPDSVSALSNLALIRATSSDPQFRNGEDAVRMAERACAVTGHDNVGCLDTLAAAYAEARRFTEAVTAGEQAAAFARAAQQVPLADEILSRVALYRDGRPYRDVAHFGAQDGSDR